MKNILLFILIAGGVFYWQTKGSANVVDNMTVAEIPEDTVVMFATKTCGYCKRARAYFEANGVKYVEYDMNASDVARQEYRKISNKRGVPLIYYKGEHMLGFNEKRLAGMLSR